MSSKLYATKASEGPSQPKGISPSILEGSILFHNHSIRVLFDMGASHSFVSKKIINDLSLDVSCLVTSLRIANPIGDLRPLVCFMMMLRWFYVAFLFVRICTLFLVWDLI